MYDTFHSHIEEKSVSEAIESCGDMIAHVHISENDRSTPGKGLVQWDATFDALRSIGYDNWLAVEAFGLALRSSPPRRRFGDGCTKMKWASPPMRSRL